MILRICDIGTRSPGTELGATVGAGAGRVAGAGGADERRSTKSRTSCFVTRPPVPVPLNLARSTLCSRASLRTSGEERTSESSSSSVVGGVEEVELGTLAATGAGGAGASFFAGAEVEGAGGAALPGAAIAPLPSPITPTIVLT